MLREIKIFIDYVLDLVPLAVVSLAQVLIVETPECFRQVVNYY